MRPRQPATAALALTLSVLLAGCSATEGDDRSATPSTTTPGSAPTATATTPAAPAPSSTPTPSVSALETVGVSSGHPLASEAGARVLEQGGNAVDAAVATAFADAVLTPSASGMGGGGVALVVADGEVDNYDYRDVVNASGEVPTSGAGVPGFVAGMARLHADHGSLDWARLLEPATALARDGVPVSGFLAGALRTGSGERATSGLPAFQRPGGGALGEGDELVQTELADTMGVLAREGPDAFYRGGLVPALTEVPGLDAESLDAYEVVLSEPASGPVGDLTMVSAAPPHPGAAIIQMVQVAEAAGTGALDPGSARAVDLQTRAWQVAEAAVQESFGDPAFVDVPVAELTDPARSAAVAVDLFGSAPGARGGSADDEGGAADEPGNTTHVSVVDAEGRAVSMTNTVTNYWGSGQEVLGFFVNDSLGRFADIGEGGANTPSPGRRSVTWSSPTALLDAEGRPVLVLGTPGGQQIPNVVAAAVTRFALHGQDVSEIVPADRFFSRGDVVSLESPALAEPLAELGWTPEVLPASQRTRFGSLQVLEVDWGTREVSGVADTRRSAGVELLSP